jgi:hypothetical protein
MSLSSLRIKTKEFFGHGPSRRVSFFVFTSNGTVSSRNKSFKRKPKGIREMRGVSSGAD